MSLLELIPVPPKSSFNLGLSSPGNRYMKNFLGHPVIDEAYRPDGSCTEPNNRKFRELLVTQDVGPFHVTGVLPAVQSLRDVLGRVESELPELYAILGTEGMLCARLTKIKKPDGSLRIGPSISNHSWGCAIDIKLNGSLDVPGNDKTQRGLLILSSYFNAAGWFWGAAFPVEDAMHFEVSKSLLGRWRRDGVL